jgi:NAD(P)-dependent dehydrogenase (short-subunit alcohol dehydrogenase family)
MRIVITGATDGIGKETASQLAAKGHNIVAVGRPGKKSEHAAAEIERRAGGDAAGGAAAAGTDAGSRKAGSVDLLTADLADMSSVAGLAGRITGDFPDLQVLVNNAAVVRKKRRETVDGLEETFAVNYLSHFLLTLKLLPLLEQNAPARIVNVSSMVHETGSIDLDDLQSERRYSASHVYARSKVAMVLFTRELARRLEGTGVTANALHPGVINTKLLHVLFAGGASVERGAETTVYLADSPEVEGTSGGYFKNSRPARSPFLEGDDHDARRLWESSERLLEDFL